MYILRSRAFSARPFMRDIIDASIPPYFERHL